MIAMQTSVISEHFLLESMAKATERLLRAGDRRGGINFALAALGDAVGAARVYILENYQESLSLRWEWTAGRAWPQIDSSQFQNIPFSTDASWYQFIGQGQTIRARVEDLAPGDRDSLKEEANREVNDNTSDDGLTKVPSRCFFIEVLKKAIARSRDNPDYLFAASSNLRWQHPTLQLQILQSWGCEFARGYFFAKPLNNKKAGQLLPEKTQKKAVLAA